MFTSRTTAMKLALVVVLVAVALSLYIHKNPESFAINSTKHVTTPLRTNGKSNSISPMPQSKTKVLVPVASQQVIDKCAQPQPGGLKQPCMVAVQLVQGMLLHLQEEADNAGQNRSSKYLADWSVASDAYTEIRSSMATPSTSYVPVISSATVTVNGLTNVEVAVVANVQIIGSGCYSPGISGTGTSKICSNQKLSISVSMVPVETGWLSDSLWIIRAEGQ